MKKTLYLLTALLVGFSACKKEVGDNGGADNGDPFENITPAITEKGTPTAESRSYTAGASGTTILSADGKLEIIIPAGALTQNTNISIQPITNLAPLGLGSGYRLGPEGTTFAKPVTLRFHYDSDLLGSANEDFLWINTQNSDGSWGAYRNSVVNKSTKTVAVETTHFSDWTIGRFIDLTLEPQTSVVKYGTTQAMAIMGFLEPDDNDEVLVPLSPIKFGPNAKVSEADRLLAATEQYLGFSIGSWTVNGSTSSSTHGWIDPGTINAIYHAPNAVPSPATAIIAVTMTAKKKNLENAQYTLVAKVTIVGVDYYLKLNVDGTEYFYTEYGVGGQLAPDPTNFQVVNLAMTDDGALGFAAGYYNGGNATNTFTAEIFRPSVGSKTLSCFNDHSDNDYDGINFSPGSSQLHWDNDNTVRKMRNGACDIDYLCAGVSFQFTKVGDAAATEVEGKFSGKIYYDGPGFDNACTTSEEHSISGEFRLVRMN